MIQPSPQPVGIDLGTTYSLLARLDASGRPVAVENAEGDILTPSFLFFDDQQVIVGKEAVKAALHEPQHAVAFMKREMGSTAFSRPINGQSIPPEVLQSYVLKKLKQDAEQRFGPITQAVITVPAFFDEPRRQATYVAGRIAGLEVLRVINEPTAAAIAYGVQSGFLNQSAESAAAERVLVYDLGGGTFDVTLMEINGTSFQALATDGDVYLGGIDWDRRLVDIAAEAFLKEAGGPDPREDPQVLLRWLIEAEELKRALSARQHSHFHAERNGQRLRIPITRQLFEERTADLLERTRFTSTSLLADAGLRPRDLTHLLLVGGSTRMPMIAEMLTRELGLNPDQSVSADEAVVHGAALYAGLLSRQATDGAAPMSVRNVNSHTLGVLGADKETGRPRVQVIIERNTPLPATQVKRFQTARTGQERIVARIVEGGDSQGIGSTTIGRCTVDNLPANLPAGTPVDIAFHYGDDGRLTVRARLPTLKTQAELTIDRACGMTAHDISAWETRVTQQINPLELNET